MEDLSSAEYNAGEVDHHGGRPNGEFQQTVEIATLQEFSQLILSQSNRMNLGSRHRRQIQKVPPQVRLRRQQIEHVYDPIMVSLGPYHHGKQELSRAEEFKHLCLDWCARGDEKKKVFFYNKIIEKIQVVRDCYAEVSIVQKYDDKALALMMLLDACIIINYIHNCIYMNRNNYLDWKNYLGAGSGPFMIRDMMMLENQIPFQVLKLLINFQYEREEAEGLFQRFLGHFSHKDPNQLKIIGEDEDPPVHFLDAFWRVVTQKNDCRPTSRERERLVSNSRWPRFLMKQAKHIIISYPHRSVMDLKAKGIRVGPNYSPSLMNITFTSHAFYGQLQLPGHPVSDLCRIILSNLIAYEVSPNCETNLAILSYVIFMKSLIQSAEDVKELQEKGILHNRLANLEKVVELFKEIDTFGLHHKDTFGLHHQDFFMDVKQRIEEHCNSKAKTWIADLIHTRFRTPWTAIALFGAVVLLCLTFLQAIFTIHPAKCNNPL